MTSRLRMFTREGGRLVYMCAAEEATQAPQMPARLRWVCSSPGIHHKSCRFFSVGNVHLSVGGADDTGVGGSKSNGGKTTGDTERDRETERQRDRETERQRDRETERQRDR